MAPLIPAEDPPASTAPCADASSLQKCVKCRELVWPTLTNPQQEKNKENMNEKQRDSPSPIKKRWLLYLEPEESSLPGLLLPLNELLTNELKLTKTFLMSFSGASSKYVTIVWSETEE